MNTQELIEEQKDVRFFSIIGIVALLAGLAYFIFTVILPAVEVMNPVGNLTILF